ncbi:unnamed protein product, partial [Aureobasidium mustum]
IIFDLRILIIDIRILIIDIRMFRSRRTWLTSARADSSSFFDDPPPSYTEACQVTILQDASPYTVACQPPIPHNASPVQRLQSFIAWRLTTEYRLETGTLRLDREQEYFLGLCKKYCMLLGMQIKSKKEVMIAKEELTRDVFKPARMLNIPADVMEGFLFFTRFFVHEDGPSTPLEVSVITYPQAVVLRIAIDYTVIIDAAVTGLNPYLASNLKKECLALHRHLFPWYLDLQTISHEYDRQQEGDYGEPSATRSSEASAAVKNNKGTIRKLFRRIATASNKQFIPNKKRDGSSGSDHAPYSEDSYTEYYDSDLSETSPLIPDQPSIHLKY